MEAATVVRDARRGARLSQRRLALRSGIPQPAIARIESGRVTPRVDTLSKLLEACGLTLDVRPRPGFGVDRTVIREFLKLSPDERVRVQAESSRNLHSLWSELREGR